jgi:3-deoxy-manno-octulosonate cytidylyltransferase (CMP-KDO synthetase)
VRILGIIPARFASTRFPGKPLAMIGKQSMIERVVEQCRKASRLDGILVATDDERIFDHVHSFGAEAVMTSSDHQSGTERCLEAADAIAGEIDAVINIQGDEPFIQPDQIDTVAGLIEDGAEIATLARKQSIADIDDPNKVKVVKDRHDRALYFSRSPIPHYRDSSGRPDHFLKHLGIYGYRYGTLRQIAKMAPGQLEQAEKLEQLRWMENGFSIHVGMTDYESPAIDSPEDLEKVLAELKG